MSSATVLLVHGSFLSGWCWLPVVERLSRAGVRSRAIELPFTSLDDDVETVRSALDHLADEGPVVAVCHSYSGLALSAAGHRATELVHVAARLPAPDEIPSAISADWNSPEFRACMRPSPDGLRLSDEAVPLLFHRSPPDLALMAMERRRPLRSEIPDRPLPDPAWTRVPTTYVVCVDDRAVPVEQQRRRAGWVERSVEIDCDHSPFFSAPDELTDVVLAAAERVAQVGATR